MKVWIFEVRTIQKTFDGEVELIRVGSSEYFQSCKGGETMSNLNKPRVFADFHNADPKAGCV